MAHGSGPFCRVSRTPIPLEVATCVRKYFLGNDLSHQWRDILAFFASGMARMPRLTNRYNDRSHSPPSACVTFIHCASYGASHEVWVLQIGMNERVRRWRRVVRIELEIHPRTI